MYMYTYMYIHVHVCTCVWFYVKESTCFTATDECFDTEEQTPTADSDFDPFRTITGISRYVCVCCLQSMLSTTTFVSVHKHFVSVHKYLVSVHKHLVSDMSTSTLCLSH